MSYKCSVCDSEEMKIGDRPAPEIGTLECRDCGSWVRWLSPKEIDTFNYHEYESALERNREDLKQLKLW